MEQHVLAGGPLNAAGFDRFLYAFFLAFSGDTAGALRPAREGRRFDPLSFKGYLTEAVMLTYAGEFEGARAGALTTLPSPTSSRRHRTTNGSQVTKSTRYGVGRATVFWSPSEIIRSAD